MGYLVEFDGKRWLFPGDTRNYDSKQLPSFGPVDGLFAHLWLGRGCALQNEHPRLNEFYHFFVGLLPKQIILTHLEDFGRDANDHWDNVHSQMVNSFITEQSPSIKISSALIGDRIEL